MKIVINILFLFISAHVVVYFAVGDNDIISNLIAGIELVLIMAFIYSRTSITNKTEEVSEDNA